MSQKISIVVAMANNRAIGINNTLPWHLPEDLKHFKAVTTGKPIIMGRKTWESLGHPLPDRRNILLSKNIAYSAKGAEVFSSLQAALTACKDASEVCIIGGANLYTQALALATNLIITEIALEVAADAFFPEFDAKKWLIKEQAAYVSAKGIHYRFVNYQHVDVEYRGKYPSK